MLFFIIQNYNIYYILKYMDGVNLYIYIYNFILINIYKFKYN